MNMIAFWIVFGVVVYLLVGGVVARVDYLDTMRKCEKCQDLDKYDQRCSTHKGDYALAVFFWGVAVIIWMPWRLCTSVGDVIDHFLTRKERQQADYLKSIEVLHDAGVDLPSDILALIGEREAA